MLIKCIFCKVAKKEKEAFHQAQLQWNRLSEVTGFIRQEGGWLEQKDHFVAVIVSFWQTKQEYQQFMDTIHDEIVIPSNQRRTYSDIKVSLLNNELLTVKESLEETSKIILHQCFINENVSINNKKIDIYLQFIENEEILIEKGWSVIQAKSLM